MRLPTKQRETFTTPFEQHKDREGQPFTVIRTYTQPDENHDAEVLPMFQIRFEDGETIDAWPEEVFEPGVVTEFLVRVTSSGYVEVDADDLGVLLTTEDARSEFELEDILPSDDPYPVRDTTVNPGEYIEDGVVVCPECGAEEIEHHELVTHRWKIRGVKADKTVVFDGHYDPFEDGERAHLFCAVCGCEWSLKSLPNGCEWD